MVAAGRDRNHLKLLPTVFIIIGDTAAEAQAKRLKFNSLVHYDSAITAFSIALGTDASKFDPDSPLAADILDTNASKSSCATLEKLQATSGSDRRDRHLS